MEEFMVYNGGVKLFFGTNAIVKAGGIVKDKNKLLIVTGRRSAEISGALGDVKALLEERGVDYCVYKGVKPNPDVETVHDIINKYKNCGAEGFIAIGGGSVIDSVKAAAVVLSGGGSVTDYLFRKRSIPRSKPFIMAVNLTHGTGTEIDRFAVVTVPEEKLKLGFGAGYPDVSVDDPRYTVTLPRNQTIYTSIDALAHSIESSTSRFASPYTRLLGREAAHIILEYLPKTLDDPGNVEYRYWLLYASMIAGISIDHGITHLGHGLEHALSGFQPSLPHGAGLAILYRKLVEIFYTYYPETMHQILKPLDPSLQPDSSDAVKAQRVFNEFLEKIGFRETLRDYGFDEDLVREMAEFYVENEWMKRYHNLSTIRVTKELVENILLCVL